MFNRSHHFAALIVLVAACGGAPSKPAAEAPRDTSNDDVAAPTSLTADSVTPFYQLLSDPGASDADERTHAFMAEDWASTPTPPGGPGRAGFVKSLAGFGQAIPDLKWEVLDTMVAGNQVVVRSRATGTPAVPFLGVNPPTGKAFEIMSIDIHTVEEGKLVRAHHIEDWSRAALQLNGQEVPPIDWETGDADWDVAPDEAKRITQRFYDLLSDASAPDADAQTAEFMADEWHSSPTPLGGPKRSGLVKSLAVFGQVIPDLKWNVEEMLVSGNRVVVRSKVTGTPAAPFLGVDPPTGKSFEIMTIDIHTLKDGKMVRGFHIEDWASARRQLTAE